MRNATFSRRLPARNEMPDLTSASVTCAIVADDDEFFRIALASILTRQLGFTEVHETASLDAALDRLDDPGGAQVTLALFDLSMPGMESASSLGAVRDCFPHVRVAVVSASCARQDILQALDAGVHGYVPKGLGAVELCRALRSIISGQIFVPPSLADVARLASSSNDAPVQAWNARRDQAARPGDLLGFLTQRQRDVLELLIEGRSNKEIARSLKLGEGTVKVHVTALLRNLGVPNRSAAAVVGTRLLRAPVEEP